MQVGRTAEARGDLNAISITLGVTPSIRASAQNAIALIDAGQAKTVGGCGARRRHNAAALTGDAVAL